MSKTAWEFLQRGTNFVAAHVSVVLGLKWQRPEDSEFQASLCYGVRPSHKQNQTGKLKTPLE